MSKTKDEKSINNEKTAGVDELKHFLKKKKIQNDVLKKLIDKQEIDLMNNKK